jgi:hypothetical protein
MSEAPSAEGLYRTDLDDYRPNFERFFAQLGLGMAHECLGCAIGEPAPFASLVATSGRI